MQPRTFKPQVPPRLIVAALAIGLFLAGFIGLAIWQSGSRIKEARMSGTIVAKEFVPKQERQIVVHRGGGMQTEEVTGDYILTVEVRQPDGSKKPYNVWIDRRRYDAVKLGDSFDVGPYLVRE